MTTDNTWASGWHKISRLMDCPGQDQSSRTNATASRYEYSYNAFHAWNSGTIPSAKKLSFFGRPSNYIQVLCLGYLGDPSSGYSGSPERAFNPALNSELQLLGLYTAHGSASNAIYLDGHVAPKWGLEIIAYGGAAVAGSPYYTDGYPFRVP
jgi:prepilin-type processing-associated H-X9-DG protein